MSALPVAVVIVLFAIGLPVTLTDHGWKPTPDRKCKYRNVTIDDIEIHQPTERTRS